MKIILDEQESQKWLHILECEKTLEESSRFPEGIQCSLQGRAEMEPVKVIIAKGPAACKKEILELDAKGMFPRQIADRLGLKFNSVRDLVYRERKKAKQPSPFAPNFTGYNKAAKASKIEVKHAEEGLCQEKAEKTALPTTTNLDPIIPTRQEAIDYIINRGVAGGHKYTAIAAKIGREVGGAYTADHVAARIRELRGDKQ